MSEPYRKVVCCRLPFEQQSPADGFSIQIHFGKQDQRGILMSGAFYQAGSFFDIAACLSQNAIVLYNCDTSQFVHSSRSGAAN